MEESELFYPYDLFIAESEICNKCGRRSMRKDMEICCRFSTDKVKVYFCKGILGIMESCHTHNNSISKITNPHF